MTFNKTRTARQGPVTHEGGRAYTIGTEYDLYLLVVTSLMSGDTFYETDDERLDRFRTLVADVVQRPGGPEFLVGLAAYARNEMYLRTTPTILATELFLQGEEEAGRRAARRAWLRGDEHLEALAYVDAVGAKRQKSFLRAVAERLGKMNEYSFVKYASGRKAYSQKDAIRLAHPVPSRENGGAQSALFKYVVHGWDALSIHEKSMLPHVKSLKDGGETQSWEQHISKHGSNPTTWGESFEKMGYMALLRNLRNLVDNNVGLNVLNAAAAKIADRDEVMKSKQLPFRFLSAYRSLPAHTPQILFDAISVATDHAVENVPTLEGDSLVLVDCSASMDGPISQRSTVSAKDAARCLGAILVRAQGAKIYQGACDLWGFGTNPVRVKVQTGNPVMATLAAMVGISGGFDWGRVQPGKTGHGTEIGKALDASLRPGLKRIVVLTDMQSHDHATPPVRRYLKDNPETMLYIIDLRGYGLPCFATDLPRTLMIGGFSDKVFQFMNAVETSDPVERIRDYAKESA